MNYASSVQPLHRKSALEHARSLWRAAEYSACLNELESVAPSPERFLLAAWALYALRRYDDALAQLAAGHAWFAASHEAEIEADALSSVLHEISRNPRESDVFYERAQRSLSAHCAPRATNMLALRAWLRDDIAACLKLLRSGETAPDDSIKAQAMSLRSWTYATRGEFALQAKLLAEIVALLSTPAKHDVGRLADTLQTLSARCRELYLPGEFAAVCSAARSIRWTSDLHEQRYNTLRHIALTLALQGQYVQGLRELQTVTALARTPARLALSLLDSAWISLASGESNSAQAYLGGALSAIGAIDWSAQIGSESSTLLLAAEISCAFDAKTARQLIDDYDKRRGALPVQTGVRHDHSFEPAEAYTRALVVAACGDVGPARKLAKRAYLQFVKMGYEWRAARCALFLYHSGCGDVWLNAAKEQARKYPRSFIGAQLQRIDADAGSETLARLTPRQRDVVRLLVEGNTVDDVAAALKTSPGTVRVHLKHIHRTLGVRNRIELLRAVKHSV